MTYRDFYFWLGEQAESLTFPNEVYFAPDFILDPVQDELG